MGRSKRIIHLCAAHYPVIAASYCCIRQARCESPIHRANATDETRHSPGDAAIARRLHKDAAHAAFDLNAGQNCLDQGASGDRQRFGDCQRTSGDRRSWVRNADKMGVVERIKACAQAIDECGIYNIEAPFAPEHGRFPWPRQTLCNR